jgi:hypothetical protein
MTRRMNQSRREFHEIVMSTRYAWSNKAFLSFQRYVAAIFKLMQRNYVIIVNLLVTFQ